MSFPEEIPVTVFFHHLFQESKSLLELAQGFLSSLGRAERCHSTVRTPRWKWALKWCPEQGSGSLSAQEMQSYKLPGAVQLGKQTRGTLLPGKHSVTTWCHPWRYCQQDTVIKCRRAYFCTSGLLCIPSWITASLPSHHLLVLSNLALPEGRSSRWLFSVWHNLG